MPVIASLDTILKELYLLGNSYMFCSALFLFTYTQGKDLLVLKLECSCSNWLEVARKTHG